jgi:ribonuclease HIII
MRRFYIFNINKEFKTLTRNSPYNLFKTFENLYYLKDDSNHLAIDLYENITSPLDRITINNKLFNSFQEDDHYSKFMNTHLYNNFYSDETTKLIVGNAYMVLDTTSPSPTFIDKLAKNSNYFACDFQNKDYFWLESIA